MFGKKAFNEIIADMLQSHCEKIKNRAAFASAVRTRDIIGNVFSYAKARGINCENPAEYVVPSTIAIFNPRDRALSKREIGIFFNTLKNAQTSHALKVALKLLMLTMVRKSNLVNATWDEIDFVAAEWTIPTEKMKVSRQGAGRPHVVYLSIQALDLFMQLYVLVSGSEYVLLSFGQSKYSTVSLSSLNRAAAHTFELAQRNGLPIEKFVLHDMRRTASTHLHEPVYHSDWIKKRYPTNRKALEQFTTRLNMHNRFREFRNDRVEIKIYRVNKIFFNLPLVAINVHYRLKIEINLLFIKVFKLICY